MYLNRSKNLRDAYLDYTRIIENYFDLSSQAGKGQEQSDIAMNFNKNIKQKLIESIETRYEELSNELKKLELEFTSEFIP